MSGDTESDALEAAIREDIEEGGDAGSIASAVAEYFIPDHDKRVRAEQREVDALTVLNAPLDSSHRRILRRDLATAIREASDD